MPETLEVSNCCEISLQSLLYLCSANVFTLRCLHQVAGVIAGGAFGDVLKVIRKKDGIVYAMKVTVIHTI